MRGPWCLRRLGLAASGEAPFQKRDMFPDLAPLMWHSFGTMIVLLQEIMSFYPALSPPKLSASVSNRACNVLALLQVWF